MTFSSLTFLFLSFPITFLLYAVIRNHTARNILLAAASLVFYKYTGFLAEIFNGITGLSIPVPQIRLPIGI